MKNEEKELDGITLNDSMEYPKQNTKNSLQNKISVVEFVIDTSQPSLKGYPWITIIELLKSEDFFVISVTRDFSDDTLIRVYLGKRLSISNDLEEDG